MGPMGFSFLLDYTICTTRVSSFGLEHRHSHYLKPIIFRVLYSSNKVRKT